jgi:hypothetical protein
MITQDHAEFIAKKLGCIPREGRAHKYQELFDGERLILKFGIRRGSKELPHGHIPRDLHLKQKECNQLHDCTISKEQYLQILRDRGYL